MQVRVLCLSPFNYKYSDREMYLQTGEDFYLDTDKSRDMLELEFLLNPYNEFNDNPYRNWLHVDNTEHVLSLLDKIKENTLGENIMGGSIELPSDINTESDAPVDTTPSPVQTELYSPELMSTVANIKHELEKELEIQTALNTGGFYTNPDLSGVATSFEPSDTTLDNVGSELQSVSNELSTISGVTRDQLNEMHYTQLQSLARSLDIDYTTKSEVIELILAKVV